jgi:poly(hydroxyalkanoate) depolymerase family esterase
MNHTFSNLMHNATHLTRTGRLKDATAAIQRALRGGAADPVAATTLVDLDEAPATVGDFSHGAHTHASLTRGYKLYTPPERAAAPLPLVVMLHGCTQNPDDFAAGTGMNELARERGFLVLYPAQSTQANPSGCWNWFKHNHQQRGRGEAALIAAMTRAVMTTNGVDAARVYIAGLSAGGAMAAIVAAAYPELYAAVGVHSGLAPGAARDLPEALAAMRGAAGPATMAAPMSAMAGERMSPRIAVPTIVFHGDRDPTVHPRNGDEVVAAALGSATTARGPSGPRIQQGVSSQGRRYTRTVHSDDSGLAVAEHWLVHGAGHAWSGGRSAGSYTDATGPDASREMLRFFLERARAVDA